MAFDEQWADDAAHKEQSTQERELQAKQRRWAELDRQELQGKGQAVQRARQERRRLRWRRTWPWLVFFGVAAILITLSRILGF